MKKNLVVFGVFIMAIFVFSACSKSPVGPSMSSMSIGANGAASSSSSSTNCVTSNSGGSTSVNTQQTSTVSTQTGDTGVTSVNSSTGVSSSMIGTANSGNTSTVSVSASETITYTLYDPEAADHTWFYVSSAPRIVWDASVVNPAYQKVRIVVMKLIPSGTFWDIKDLTRSSGSVIYGSTSSGTVVTPAVTLTPGNYYVSIIVYDNETDYNSLGGGGNFTVR